MKFKSITFKILFLVFCAFLITAVSVVMVADRKLIQIIDDSQNATYKEKLEMIRSTLSRTDARLQKTGLVDAYSEDFKASTVTQLRKAYYTGEEQEVFPFILDHEGTVIMHPLRLAGDTSPQKYEWVQTMLSSQKGQVTGTYLGRSKYYTYIHFAPWNWIIGFAVPLDIKYAAASKFNIILTGIMAGICLPVLLILSLIIRRFTTPVTRLTVATKAMADGDLEQEFDLKGTCEVGDLSRSFSHMRNSVQQTISELQKENSKRRQAENTLRESEERFRKLFEQASDAFFVHDAKNGIILNANISACASLGYTLEELKQLHIADIEVSFSQEQVVEIAQKVLQGEHTVVEGIHQRKDGSTFPVEISLGLNQEKAGLFLSIVRDISEKKEAEMKLGAEKERLAVTLRSIGDAVITTDTTGKIVFLNKIAEKLTGWTNQEAAGEPSSEIFQIINEKTGQKCASPVQRVLELGRIIGLANHTALIARDGSVRSIADSGAPIRDQDSKIRGVVLVFRDISHEKKMEEELLKVKKLEAIGVLAGGIAHDFNNILAAILGNIELAGYRIDKEDSKTTSLLAHAQKATKRAAKLTGQLLTFSKGGKPVKEEVSLPDLISESADFVLHGSKVICNYVCPNDLWRVDVDGGQIGQVIQNIIINANQAMPEGGTIVVACGNVEDTGAETLLSAHKGDYVRITIQDTGVGIPPDIVNKVFDPYFTTKQEGSGLGLAICYSIVNKHDGYLMVRSDIGKGTTFTLYLPAIRSTDNIVITEKINIESSVKAVRVMVMDDEEMLRDVAKAQLNMLGHEAIPVSDGAQAINRYQEMQDLGTPVDLVIMDLTIPGGMGGQEAAEKLLKIDPEARIIVASGYSNDPVLADYKKYGFRAAIIKPFDLKDLSTAIASVL